MSRTGSLQEEFVRAKLSNLVIMNWTDGKLYQTNRPTGRRGYGNRRRSKDLLAKSGPRPPIKRPRDPAIVDKFHPPPSQPNLAPDHHVVVPTTRSRDPAIYDNLPTTVDEFLKEWNIEPTIGDVTNHTSTQRHHEDIKKLNKRILSRPSLVPPRLPPMEPTKKRRLRETKITDMEAFKRQRRETLPHIIQGRQELRRRMQAGNNPPPIHEVKIRIGSQEKGLGASSTNISRKSSDRESTVLPRSKKTKRRLSATSSSRPSETLDEPEVRSRLLTHSPMIYAPAPRRHTSKYFNLSDTFDSQDTNSAVAQPPRAVPPVPSSQRSENRIWRNWLESASGAAQTDRAVEGSFDSLQWPPVSPGISEAYEAPRERIRPDVFSSEISSDNPGQGSQVSDVASDELISSGSSFIVKRNNDPSDSDEVQRHQLHTEYPPRISPEPTYRQYCGASIYDHGLSRVILDAHASDPVLEPEDPEEAWKAFIFRGADSDDIEQAAFEEAKHDAARDIRPSDTSSVHVEPQISDTVSNMGTIGTVYTYQNSQYEPSDEFEVVEESHETFHSVQTALSSSSVEVEVSTDNYEENEEIQTSSSADPVISDSSHETSDSAIPASAMEVQVTNSLDSDITASPTKTSVNSSVDGSTNDSASNSIILRENLASSLSEPQPHSIASDLDSTVVQPPKSEVRTAKPNANFRFAPPKLFVGSLSNNHLRRPAPNQILSLGKKKRGRQKKRAGDGRADIRALPNYSSDPIEEIEDDVQDSRFGPLELE